MTHLDKTLKDISPDKLEIYQLFYSLLPAQKVRIVEEMKKLIEKYKTKHSC
jgi:hypothetical protein